MQLPLVQQLEPARGRGWVYGWTEERTVVVRAWTPDDLVNEQVELSVMVSGGCPQLQPTFEADLDAPGLKERIAGLKAIREQASADAERRGAAGPWAFSG